MQLNLTFERDYDQRWYAVIPSWDGDRSELEMVMGADLMLDMLSQNMFDDSNKIPLFLSTSYTNINPLIILKRLDKPTDDFGGSFYACHYGETVFEIWLCSVTLHVFGEYPETIYIN